MKTSKLATSEEITRHYVHFNETDHKGARALVEVTATQIRLTLFDGDLPKVAPQVFIDTAPDRPKEYYASRMIEKWDKLYGVKEAVPKARRPPKRKGSELSPASQTLLRVLGESGGRMQAQELVKKSGLPFYTVNGCLSILVGKGLVGSESALGGKTIRLLG